METASKELGLRECAAHDEHIFVPDAVRAPVFAQQLADLDRRLTRRTKRINAASSPQEAARNLRELSDIADIYARRLDDLEPPYWARKESDKYVTALRVLGTVLDKGAKELSEPPITPAEAAAFDSRLKRAGRAERKGIKKLLKSIGAIPTAPGRGGEDEEPAGDERPGSLSRRAAATAAACTACSAAQTRSSASSYQTSSWPGAIRNRQPGGSARYGRTSGIRDSRCSTCKGSKKSSSWPSSVPGQRYQPFVGPDGGCRRPFSGHSLGPMSAIPTVVPGAGRFGVHADLRQYGSLRLAGSHSARSGVARSPHTGEGWIAFCSSRPSARRVRRSGERRRRRRGRHACSWNRASVTRARGARARAARRGRR